MIGYRRILIGEGGTAARCMACARGSGERRAFRPVDDVVHELGRLARESVKPDGVILDGCEPFAHPRLPDIVAAVRRVGVERICLRTDAGALARGDNAAGALAAGVTHIDVVLLADSHDQDRLTGVQGLASACIAGVQAFVAAAQAAGRRVAVTGRVPLCRHNAQVGAHAVARLAALGAVAVCVEAKNLRPGDIGYLSAALDTAAVNGVHAWTAAPADSLPRPSAVPPWHETTEPCL